jgi:hypothetical protein
MWKPSQVCRRMRIEYRSLALRQQQLTFNVKNWLRYVDSVCGSLNPSIYVPKRIDLLIVDPLHTRLRLDVLPLLRARHCNSHRKGSASISFEPTFSKRSAATQARIHSVIDYKDPRWLACLQSEDIAEVVIHAGRACLDYCSAIVRVVVVFKSGKAPGRLTSEAMVSELVVRDEGFVDKFAESVGFTKRRGLDIHASIERHCKNAWPLRPTQYFLK